MGAPIDTPAEIQEPHRAVPLRRAKRRARSILLWTLVFIAVLHIGVLAYIERSPEMRDPLFEERVNLLRHHYSIAKTERPLLVFMIGTSRTGNGFDAGRAQEQLRRELGREVIAFNCGIAGVGPIGEQLYLKRLLNKGIRPDLLILEVMPIYYVEWGASPFEILGIDPNRINGDEIDVLESYQIPADLIRRQWRDIQINPWGEMRWHLLKRIWPEALPKDAVLNWNSGADPWGYRPINIDVMDPGEYRRLNNFAYGEQGQYFAEFQFGESAKRSLEDTVAFCKKEGLPTLMIHMPEDSRFRSWYTPASIARITDTFAQIAQRQNATFIDAHEWVPDGNFWDGHHLLVKGSRLLTDRLTSDYILPRLRTIP